MLVERFLSVLITLFGAKTFGISDIQGNRTVALQPTRAIVTMLHPNGKTLDGVFAGTLGGLARARKHSPRPPRCERGYNSNKARRCNHLAFLGRL